MLDTDTKRRIDTARDILVGKVPDPKSQVEQITIALIYKFMDDMDASAEELGGERSFFAGEYARYGWAKLMNSGLGGHETLALYAEAITKMTENTALPALFRDIFKNAYLPYRDPETLRAFLKIIDEFSYDHSEKLGDAFEYLLSVLGSQGDAGQFRTPRHIIDFMVKVVAPKKDEIVLDPACGTAGFLISAWKHILRANTSGGAGCPTPKPSPPAPLPGGEGRTQNPPALVSGEEASGHYRGGYDFSGLKKRARDLRKKQTDAEALLWELLRNRQLCDAKFRRQHQFGDYICDFYCHEAKLVVECDGEVHSTANRTPKDKKRDAYLRSQGLNVLRFQNKQILQDPETVLEAIAARFVPPSPPGRGAGGEGSPAQPAANRPGDRLTPEEKHRLANNFKGYDISPDMVRLSLVNLYLHGFTDPHVYEYDTLTSEERWNEFADVILANPPFMSPKGGIKPHKRFSIQAKRSEVLFVDYMAEHLTPQGRAAIIVPEGIIFQSQTAYKALRKMLVENSLVAVVSLPAGCFNPYSGVKTSILLLEKSLARQSDTIAFFKVENDGFGLGAQRRAIEKNDLPQVQAELATFLQTLRDRQPTADLQPTCGRIVPKEKIAANGEYNLSGERYREGVASNHAFPLVFLGEETLFRVESGGTPKSDVEEFWGGGIPWATLVDLPATDFISEITATKRTISEEGLRGSSAKMIPANSIIVSTRATIGRIAINRLPIATNQGFKNVVIQNSARAVPEFVALALTKLVPTMQAWATGGTFAEISKSKFCELQIPLPPLSVQQDIVAEIEGYQKVINGARAVLDHYRPHIPIHPDWPVEVLGAVSEVTSSKRILAEEYVPSGTPFYRTKEIVELSRGKEIGLELFISQVRFESIRTRFGAPAKGELLISAVGTIGVSWVVADDREFYFKDGNLLWIRRLSNLDPYFLKYCLDSTFSGGVDHIVFGAAYKALTIEKLTEFKIPLPPLATQRAIVAEIEAEQALVSANRELITRFEQKIQATLARVWGEPPSVENG